MASASPLFDKTMHLRARWVRADYATGAFAVGAVSAYVSGRSSFAGRAISSPHGAADIAFTGIAMPQSVTLDREEIWLLADRLERKPDGDYRRNAGHMPRIASHLDAALPWGIGEESARRIVEGFSRWVVDTYGVAVEFAAHNKEKPLDHAHFVMGTRVLTEDGFGKKVRQLNGIAQQHGDRKNGKEIAHQREDGTTKRVSSAMDEIRAKWAELVSREIGHAVDHRSYERRGLNITPVPRVRRGEIEFQKRVEYRTGVAPAWRKDRARRMAARTKTPATVKDIPTIAIPDRQNGGVLRDIRRRPKRANTIAAPATPAAKAAERYIARLREDIVARGVVADDKRLAIGLHLDDAEIARGEDVSGHLGTARHNLAVDGSAGGFAGSSRWRRRSDEILSGYSDERAALIQRHKRETGELQRKQRVALVLVEKLVEHDALVALPRLAEWARRFAEVGGSLAAAHDEECQKLFAAQRSGWHLAIQEEVEIERRTAPEMARSTSNAASVAHRTGKHGIRRSQRRKAPAPAIVAEMADRQIGKLREHIADRQLTSHDDRLEAGRSIDAAEVLQAEQVLSHPATGRNQRTPDGSPRTLDGSSRWHRRSDDIRNGHGEQRAALIDQQRREESELGRRQRLILELVEKLRQSDAALALYRLAKCARRFADEVKTLVAAHDEQWLKLFAAQRTAWRATVEEEVNDRRQASGKTDGSLPDAPAVSNGAFHDLIMPKRRRREASVPTGQHMANALLASLRKRVDVSFSGEREAWRIQANDDDSARISQGKSEIRARAFQSVQRTNSAIATPDAKFDKMADGFCARWQERVLAALAAQNRARHDMFLAQEQEESHLRRRQNLTLVILERMIALDALLAMLRLVEAARQFALETHALLERQGQDWLDLVAAQRTAWPALPLSRETGSPANSFLPEGGNLPGRALARPSAPAHTPPGRAEVGRAPAQTANLPKPSQAHVRIVEELADWLVLRHQRSPERNLMLATFLSEPVEAFDARTNQRRDAALERARAFGPGNQDLWAPRSPKDILDDPIMASCADLRDLVLRVGTRSKSPAPPRRYEPGSNSMVPNDKGNGRK